MANDPIKQLPHMRAVDFRELSADLTPRVLAAIRPDDYAALPKAAAFALKPLLRKGFALSRETNQNDLISAFTMLGVYGEHDRAAQAAKVMLEIPIDKYWVPNNSYIMMAVAVAYYFAAEAHSEAAAELAPHVIRPHDYRPQQPVFDGRLLTPYLDEPFNYGINNEHRSAYPKWYDAMLYTHAIAQFVYLWLFGGSALWPRERLEREIERYRQAVFKEPGFAPV